MSGQSSIPFETSQGPSRPPSRSGPTGNERPKARFRSPQVQGNHKGQAGEPGRSRTISQGGGQLTPAGPQTTSYPAGILRPHSAAGHQGPQRTLGGRPRTQSRAGRDDSSSKSSSAASNMFPELHPNFPQFPPAGSFPEGYQSQGPSGPPRPPSRAGPTRPLPPGGPAGRSSPAPSGAAAGRSSPAPSGGEPRRPPSAPPGGQPRRPPSAPPGTRAPASTTECTCTPLSALCQGARRPCSAADRHLKRCCTHSTRVLHERD
ncbi:hypothetical protein DFH11DRAFT_207693 [Phellopilus nigrolimitatus]|nr:hypothetical protein DFH11DRAFT_207693 [Phellopilus nigrolimitatus]